MPFGLIRSFAGYHLLNAPGPEVSASEINGLLLVLALSLVLVLAAYWHTRYSPQVKSVHGAAHPPEEHAAEAVLTSEPATPSLDVPDVENSDAAVEVVEAGAADDLTRIEGIGPKIAEILQGAGITTYARLAETPVETLQSILEAAGSRFRLADPTTWPQQAHHAAAGEWDVLIALQERLKGGQYRQD